MARDGFQRRCNASKVPSVRVLIVRRTVSLLLATTIIVFIGMRIPVKASFAASGQGTDAATERKQVDAPVAPRGILDLQKFRQATSLTIAPPGGSEITATLINLNPAVNQWYVLILARKGRASNFYHIENPRPLSQKVVLDPEHPFGIEIVEGKTKIDCNLFEPTPNALDQARSSNLAYAPLCGPRLYLRNRVNGHRTALEAGAELMRKYPWGEGVITVFHDLLKDTQRETAEIYTEKAARTDDTQSRASLLPSSARIDRTYAGYLIRPTGLEIPLDGGRVSSVRPGEWYPTDGNPGIYVSVIEPGLIDPTILESYKGTVANLDQVEASALCYLVAFDLNTFKIAYSLGTDNPAVNWSTHIRPGVKDRNLPGPDGIGTIFPLISTGEISPSEASKVVATFTGGFKRQHGAFKFGKFASQNSGSHYGFWERGVEFSKLQPGLATIFLLDDGSLHMETWARQDDRNLSRITWARQNGLPLVEFDQRSQSTVPGPLVNNWGAGNWSGSEDRKLRTIRSGAAVQWNGRTRFFVYAVFSDATPSAMARVFQAYQFRYGMLLDMNALEHTYLALYRRIGAKFEVDHLLSGMRSVDKSGSGVLPARFLTYPDNRDFFYVTRRNRHEGVPR